MRRDREEYQCEYNALAVEHERVSEEIRRAEVQIKERVEHRRKIEMFQWMFAEQEACAGFEPYAFVTLVEKVVDGCDGRLEFYFRNGMRYEHRLIKRPVIREQSSAPLKNCRNLRAGVHQLGRFRAGDLPAGGHGHAGGSRDDGGVRPFEGRAAVQQPARQDKARGKRLCAPAGLAGCAGEVSGRAAGAESLKTEKKTGALALSGWRAVLC